MSRNNYDAERGEQTQRLIPGPLQLPPLVAGQKVKSGPYTITVTDEMVVQRERANEELYRAWLREQERRVAHEEGEQYVGDFKDATIRRIFVTKVFCLLTMQLLFSACIIALFIFVESAKKFMLVHWYIWIIALIFFAISYCSISFSACARRQFPNNFICLCLLTLSMSYLAACASVFYSIEVILLAIGMTAITTLTISVTATCTKFDLTMRTGMMAIIGLVAIVSLIVMTIVLMFTYIKVLHITIAVIGTLLLSMYLFFDIQTIMGGRRVELGPDEIVFATTQLYVDIILLYQYILMLAGFIHNR